MENPLDLTMVLIWLTGIGAVIAVNWIAAKLAERAEWWNALPTTAKYLIPPVAAVLIALGANELLKLPDFLAGIQPYWSLIIAVLLGYFGSQAGHLQAKAAYEPKVVIITKTLDDKSADLPPVQ